ncbi:MAG: argininosuccinate lyase [Candidatus Bathyarchaeia archaeon]
MSSGDPRRLHLTEARLRSPPADKMVKYVHAPTLKGELKRFTHSCQVDLAHTVMLAEGGIIPVDDAAKILVVLKEIESLGAERFPVDAEAGSLLLQVEAYLFDRLGEEIGGKMHTGRSRWDRGRAIWRMYARDRALDVLRRLINLQEVIIHLSEKHVDTVMPGYTHLQHAQPWTFGHYLISFFYAFHRDFGRLKHAYGNTNLNVLGSAAQAGTSWPVNRRRTTELLGFDGLLLNSREVFREDYKVDILAALAQTLSDLNDLASDLLVWSSYEFGMMESSDAYAGSSSIMPQKKNPSALEAVQQRAALGIGYLASALGGLRAVGTVRSGSVEMLVDALDVTGETLDLMAGILETLVVHEDRMLELSGASWSTANELADTIVREVGISFRRAHHVVARLVRIAIEEGKRPGEVTSDMVNRAAEEMLGFPLNLEDDIIRRALDPVEFINTRVTEGSVNPKEVDEMLQDCSEKLAEEHGWLTEQEHRIREAEEKLGRAVEAILNTST